MKKKMLLLFVIMVVGLFACSDQEQSKNNAMPELVEVEILFSPKDIEVGQKTTIQAKITQGNDFVNDAQDMEFEIWEKGVSEDQHTKIDGEPQGEGIYSVTQTFQESGTYYVIAHVTARDMHTMPKKEFIVMETN